MALPIFRNTFNLSKIIFVKGTKPNVITNVGGTKGFFTNMMNYSKYSVSLFCDRIDCQPTIFLRNYGKQAERGAKFSSESESDSDLDEPGHRGESEFFRRKIRTFHNIIDINKDGVISFHDFELLIQRFVALGNLSEKDTQDFKQIIQEWWTKRWGEPNQYNLVTVERYLDYMHHVLNDKKLVRRAHSFIPYIFRAIDKDQSGIITFEEYKLFFECLGLPEKDALLAFTAIDSNGDGKITFKEFIKHGRDFFVTEDEDRISKYFWGPLVK